eukprot:scaffold8452_cov185-Ochromonas_danica.AAC.24
MVTPKMTSSSIFLCFLCITLLAFRDVSCTTTTTSDTTTTSSLPSDIHRLYRHKFVSSLEKNPITEMTYIASAHPHQKHQVTFAIQQQNLDQLTDFVHQVSDPTNPIYGQHKTHQEVQDLVQNEEGYSLLKTFLEYHGITIVKEHRFHLFLTAETNISQWEKVFNTKFHQYKLSWKPKESIIRSESLSLPIHLADHIASVYGTVDVPAEVFARPSVHGEAESGSLRGFETLTSFSNMVTPSLLRSYYDIGVTYGSSSLKQTIYGAISQEVSLADLNLFQGAFSLLKQNLSSQVGDMVISETCPSASADDCMEANLDVQYIMAVAQNVSTTYYYNTQGDWVSWLEDISSWDDPPSVISISYCSYEIGVTSYITSFETEAKKLAAQGVTLIAASGDDGVSGWLTRGYYSRCAYNPMFPACSNYVTAVGGTQGPEEGSAEVTCQASVSNQVLITSGGGISTTRPLQSWQSSEVSAYFKTVSTSPYSGYDISGRGYPDVSLLAHSYVIVVSGQYQVVDGTSASAPAFAGMVSLVNSARVSKGLSKLGWLNPYLYRNASAFVRDITSGHNKCTALYESGNSYATTCCNQGFYAATGWDPVTGLGSIDFDSFYSFFANSTVVEADDDSSSSGSSGSSVPVGVVVGVVIGVVLGGIILAGLFAFLRSYCSSSGTSGSARYQVPSAQVTVPSAPEFRVTYVTAQPL